MSYIQTGNNAELYTLSHLFNVGVEGHGSGNCIGGLIRLTLLVVKIYIISLYYSIQILIPKIFVFD